jgi:hypothetical protein
MKRWHAWFATAIAALGLAAVFELYTQPEFLMQLANQVWACF